MSNLPPVSPENPFPQFPAEPPRAGGWWKIVAIIFGLLALIPLCCCTGVLGLSIWNSGDEIVIFNARRTLLSVDVDYKFHRQPVRNTRYSLVVEDAQGSRSEWFSIGELQSQGTFTGTGARMPRGRCKVYFEASRPGRNHQRTSNVLNLD